MGIGNAATDMTGRMPNGTAQADGSMKVESTFDVAHVASTVVYMSNLPLDTNVQLSHDHGDRHALYRPGVNGGIAVRS